LFMKSEIVSMKQLIYITLLLLCASGAQEQSITSTQKGTTMTFEELIPKIAQGAGINKGEIVLLQLWGEKENLPILDRFAIEVAQAGGIPVKWNYSREYIKEYFSTVPGENLAFPEKYFDIFKPADVVIDILTYPPSPAAGFPKEKLPFYGKYMGQLFRTLTQKRTFIQVKVPSAENAAEAGVNKDIFETALLSAMDIDYPKMKTTCSVLAREFENASEGKIHTEKGCEFSFSFKTRQWHKDDGSGDIPCGEIYVSPIEESGQGSLFVPEVVIDGRKYNNVILKFKNGKLESASEPEVLEYVRSAPGDCDMLAEFGIGLNPGVNKLIGYSGTDEKMMGTVHVAVGMNNLAGGKNKTPMHLDFILRPEKVEIDGKTIIKNGRFTKELAEKLK
jgi:aminopeptidase